MIEKSLHFLHYFDIWIDLIVNSNHISHIYLTHAIGYLRTLEVSDQTVSVQDTGKGKELAQEWIGIDEITERGREIYKF